MRGDALTAVLSFSTQSSLDHEFKIGPIRAAFSNYWEVVFGEAVPIGRLRELTQRLSSNEHSHPLEQLQDCQSKSHLQDELYSLLKYLEQVSAFDREEDTSFARLDSSTVERRLTGADELLTP